MYFVGLSAKLLDPKIRPPNDARNTKGGKWVRKEIWLWLHLLFGE